MQNMNFTSKAHHPYSLISYLFSVVFRSILTIVRLLLVKVENEVSRRVCRTVATKLGNHKRNSVSNASKVWPLRTYKCLTSNSWSLRLPYYILYCPVKLFYSHISLWFFSQDGAQLNTRTYQHTQDYSQVSIV